MVVYLSCEYLNSKHFTHTFIIKNVIIHIHIPKFTSLLFSLFKNMIYNIRQVIFCPIFFNLQIRFHKFSGSNSVEYLGIAGIAVEYRCMISVCC